MTEGAGWSRRDRALAELARARGWVEDGALDALLAGEPEAGGTGGALLRRGLLTREQVESLDEAVGGAGSRDGAPATGADATMIAGTRAGNAPVAAGAAPGNIGPYRILRELGRGGMGVVYRALDPQLRREVALKVLLAGADASDQAVERFRREASLLARVGAHPHLVHVHDVGRDEGRLYFTMDYIEGRSLRDRLDREGPLPPREAARIAAEVASALEAAHRAGVVHRDVKPHNILLGADGSAFLTDFGLAREADGGRGLTVTGDVLGTPAYMSPEQAAGQGKGAGPAVDIWSLGATLFEMLTGRTPFTGATPAEILRRVVEEEAPTPGSVTGGLHEDLDTVCAAALRREPARRYPSAAEFEADLRRFLAGENVRARRISGMERLLAKLRRRKAVAAAVVLGLALSGAAGAQAWQRRLEADAARRAEEARVSEGQALLKRGRGHLEAFEAAIAAGDKQGFLTSLPSAVRDLRAAATLLSDDDAAAAWLGRALRQSGFDDEARAELARATALNPRQTLAWAELGAIALDRLRKARGELRHHVYRLSGLATASGSRLEHGVDLAGSTDADTAHLREEALACFARLGELEVSPGVAAYGRGVTALMTGDLPAAIRELDLAIALDPFMAEAWEARAEAKDLDASLPRGGVDDWRRLCDLRPLNVGALQRYGLAMVRSGESDRVSEIVAKIEERFGGDASLLASTAVILYGCGRYEESERMALRALAGMPAGGNRDRTSLLIVQTHLARRDFAAARAFVERNSDRLSPSARDHGEMLVLFEESRWKDARDRMRAVQRSEPGLLVQSDHPATIEWRCGNLDLALAGPLTRDGLGTSTFGIWVRGIVFMDAGQLEQALRNFEAVRARRPDFTTNLVHLAGARFLAGDDPGATAALEEAIAVISIPEEARKTVQNVLATFRSKLEAAKTPAERGKVVEGLAGAVGFLAATQPEGSLTRRGARAAANALLYLLQEFYYREGLLDESIAAGEPLLKAEPWGCNYYKDARARAAAGKKKSALASLRRAVEEGFDDGRRLDAEKAFDALREDPAFRELRARCR